MSYSEFIIKKCVIMRKGDKNNNDNDKIIMLMMIIIYRNEFCIDFGKLVYVDEY